jgi:sterol 14alpha-demethylase
MATASFTSAPGGQEPPKMPGSLPLLGNMIEFGKQPYLYMKKVRDMLGDIGSFRMFHQTMILMTGADASEAFYRADDDTFDQSSAYKLMTPIFGHGVVFDAPVDRKNQQLKMMMPALRDKPMRGYSDLIVQEVEGMIKNWGERGEIDLAMFMKELTIYTASHCLLGKEFRYELSGEFAQIYHDLEAGVQPIAYVFPNLPIPSFRRRDKARVRLVALVEQIIDKRAKSAKKSEDMFQMLIDSRYEDGSKLSPHEITGMLTATIFAGHHTSSGTAAWVLLELLKRPQYMTRVVDELDTLFGVDGEVTFQSLRQVPNLENVIKESLRLHPPLIILMRKILHDFQYKGYTFKAGDFVCAAPPVTHRVDSIFPNPEQFDPDRYSDERAEDRQTMCGWQAFGGGKHKCSGNAFAMFQIKAIFTILLRRYEFELVGKPEDYVDDYTQTIVQPRSPCLIRYRRRAQKQEAVVAANIESAVAGAAHAVQQKAHLRVEIDQTLCQGHAVCVGEAADVFAVDEKLSIGIVKNATPGEEFYEKVRKAERLCPNRAITVTEVKPEGGASGCPFH